MAVLLLVVIKAPHLMRLVARQGCPKCSSKILKRSNKHMLQCEKCGHIFSIKPETKK